MSTFDEMYRGTPPWEIGRPQPAIVKLADAGLLGGDVLDIGCGTGENALALAARGARVVGVDVSPRALAQARKKAALAGANARFEEVDALELHEVGGRFDAAIDSGCFHVFSDDAREEYVRSLGGVLKPGATLYLLVFSEHEAPWGGPRRVTQKELRATFRRPFVVEDIAAARYAHNLSAEGAQAWLARVTYVGRAVSTGN